MYTAGLRAGAGVHGAESGSLTFGIARAACSGCEASGHGWLAGL